MDIKEIAVAAAVSCLGDHPLLWMEKIIGVKVSHSDTCIHTWRSRAILTEVKQMCSVTTLLLEEDLNSYWERWRETQVQTEKDRD